MRGKGLSQYKRVPFGFKLLVLNAMIVKIVAQTEKNVYSKVIGAISFNVLKKYFILLTQWNEMKFWLYFLFQFSLSIIVFNKVKVVNR